MKNLISLGLVFLFFQSSLSFADQANSGLTSRVKSFFSSCISIFKKNASTKIKIKTVGNSGADLDLYSDGTVDVYGHPYHGGFIPYNLRHELHDITDVVATEKGFLLKRKDGRVFTLASSDAINTDGIRLSTLAFSDAINTDDIDNLTGIGQIHSLSDNYRSCLT